MTAFVAICLCKMCLPGPGRTNESQILMSMDRRQRWQGPKPVDMFAFDDRKVEIVECLRHLKWKSTGSKIHIYGRFRLLVT